MAKVICIDPVKSLSGKMKKDCNVYFTTNRRTGVCHAIQRDESTYHQNDSPAQRKCQAEFRATQERVDAWIREQQLNPTPLYYAALADYNAQHRTSFFRSFLHRHAARYGIKTT